MNLKKLYPELFPKTINYWRIPSKTTKGLEYVVSQKKDGTYSCECSGYRTTGNCRHIKRLRNQLAGYYYE
jgi:hypothetical protein